jgi:NCAIR mutase (PurE)-related protein
VTAVNPEHLRALLEAVRAAKTGVDQALRELRDLPFRSLGFAHADTHRHLRTGISRGDFRHWQDTSQIATLLTSLAATAPR